MPDEYIAKKEKKLNLSLASHFDILDYIQITPAWALPAFLAFLLCAVPAILVFFLAEVYFRILFYFRIRPVKPPGNLFFVLFLFFVGFGFVGLLYISFPHVYLKKWPTLPKTQLLIALVRCLRDCAVGVGGLFFF